MNTLSSTFGTRLTQREKEVLMYVAEGWRTKEIADKLSISEYTVANHRKSVIRKKGVKTVKQLFKKATADNDRMIGQQRLVTSLSGIMPMVR